MNPIRRAACAAVVCVAALAFCPRGGALARAAATATPASSFVPLTQPTPQVGTPIMVDDLLAESREYDNKPVQATGIAQNIRTDQTPRGPILQFDLCGHHCIHILDATNPVLADGDTRTIRGTFYRHLTRGHFSADDIIVIAPGGLPPDDSQNWRRGFDQWQTPRPASPRA